MIVDVDGKFLMCGYEVVVVVKKVREGKGKDVYGFKIY